MLPTFSQLTNNKQPVSKFFSVIHFLAIIYFQTVKSGKHTADLRLKVANKVTCIGRRLAIVDTDKNQQVALLITTNE